MKLLHTSDWHLGRSLYGRKRHDEFSSFLDWLVSIIKQESVDVVAIAGDIFDNGTPGTKAQELYYSFLAKTAGTGCSHVVVIAGNHDSPLFLDAPKSILRALRVHVTGGASEDPENEVRSLETGKGERLIVCSVPFLRDADVRLAAPGESADDKFAKLTDGIHRHFSRVIEHAQHVRETFTTDIIAKRDIHIPVIVMGHLFTAGGKTVDGDGVRELYVGTAVHVSPVLFTSGIDYVALGHLHTAQRVADSDRIYYPGSPIPMGFGEAGQEKSIALIEFTEGHRTFNTIPVPTFRQLAVVKGSVEEVGEQLTAFVKKGSPVWIEVHCSEKTDAALMRTSFENITVGSPVEILRIRNNKPIEQVMERADHAEQMDDLAPKDVFSRCCDQHDVAASDRAELETCFDEIIASFDNI